MRTAARIVLAALAALCAPAAGPGQAAGPSGLEGGRIDLAVLAGDLIRGDGSSTGPATLLVGGGRIMAVLPGHRKPPGVVVMNAAESVVMPGMIDLRTRAGLPGNPVEESREVWQGFSPLDVADPTHIDWHRALAGGVTTTALVPGDRAVVGGLVSVVKTDPTLEHTSRVLERAAALKAALGREPSWDNRPVRHGVPMDFYYRRPTDRMGVLAAARAAFREPRGPLEEATRGELPVWFTARQEPDLRAMIGLAEEFGLRVAALEATEGHMAADRLAKAGVPVVLGPLYNYPREPFEWREGRDLRWNNAGILHEAGVEVALSTGGGLPGALRDAAILAHRYGLPREAALAAVTGAPARLLGLEGKVGDLAPGMDADFLIFPGDPLEAATPLGGVVVLGRIAWTLPEPPVPPAETEPMTEEP